VQVVEVVPATFQMAQQVIPLMEEQVAQPEMHMETLI
jgi:hypothetical protein